MKFPISAAVAIGFGLIVLLGYFVEIPLLVNLRTIFLQWALILAAVALVVGVANLARVHIHKMQTSSPSNRVHSTVLLVALLATLVVVGWQGPVGSGSMWIFNNIQVPIESSLMALLAVVLVYSGARMLRRKLTVFAVVFFITALVVLLGAAPIFGVTLPGLQGPGGLRALILEIPAAAGARGILLGVGLGVVAAGLRVLLGADRPYGG